MVTMRVQHSKVVIDEMLIGVAFGSDSGWGCLAV